MQEIPSAYKYIWDINGRVTLYDDVIKWNHFSRHWPFVREIHRSPVHSPHKGQWCGTLMFSSICAWISGSVNNHEAGDLRHHRAYYDVIVHSYINNSSDHTHILMLGVIGITGIFYHPIIQKLVLSLQFESRISGIRSQLLTLLRIIARALPFRSNFTVYWWPMHRCLAKQISNMHYNT